MPAASRPDLLAMGMEAAALALGTHIGEFVIAETLRTHGGITVLRAVQPSVDRTVALYVAPSEAPEARELLARARALAAVDHPHVVPVYEVGSEQGRVFAATRLPDARPAAAVIEDGLLPPAVGVSVIEQVADALEALERAGVSVAPLSADVLLEGHRDAPSALLAPLESSTVGRRPSMGVADLLSTLTGPAGDPASTAARRAAATGSPTEVAAAARAALPSPRSRGFPTRLAAAVVAIAAAALVLVLVLAPGGDSGTAGLGAAARIAATIPVGAEPIDAAAVGDALWVTTTDGRLVRVDPASNRVVGAPQRLGRGPVSLVVGDSGLFAFDSDRGVVMRLDPRTGAVLRRRRVEGGTPLTGAVVGHTLWVGRQPPEQDRAGQSEVLALDARSLAPTGRSLPVGNMPAQIRVDGSTLLVVGQQDGTLTRIDTRTGDMRRVLVSPSPGRPALLGTTLWVPDGVSGVVTEIDDRLDRPPTAVLPLGDSPVVVVAGGAPWALLADQRSGSGAAARLVRLDARARIVGRPLDLGRGAENVVAAGGDLWVTSIRRRALIRVTPIEPAPAAAAVREPDPGRLRAGPSRAGRRSATVTDVTVSVDPGGTGWLVTAEPEVIDLRRFDEPGIGVSVVVPDQVFGARGSAHPVKDAAGLMRGVRAVPGLRVRDERATAVGGLPARSAMLSVRPGAPRASFCGGPCAPLYGRDRVTQLVAAPARGRLTVVDVDGHAVAILEDTPDGRSLASTDEIVRSLRLE